MYLLFDIGGTKTRLAVSHDGESFGEPHIIPTPQNFEEAMEAYRKEIASLEGGFKAAGCGVAGTLSLEQDALVSAPHLSDWVGKPLKKRLESLLDVPVFLANDTALVGLGEAVQGAGQGGRIVAYVTVSTGVGGVRIVDGAIDRATYGFEPGHQFVENGLTLEQLVSGSALEAKYGQKPVEISEQAVWQEAARHLAMGLHNTVLHWSPDTVVVGGSMLNTVGISLGAVREHLEKTLEAFPELPRIEHSQLGDLGGLHGALAFLKQRFS
ncbi:MAG TPA: ROK family protein [Candidatus Paceibacterota bacterium]|nr:ROK family protein [Candidatus Paceibacterota bacterium]